MPAPKNFSYSTIATAPSPANSGTSIVVAPGEGVRFPDPPFFATVWPVSVSPDSSNAEIVKVTGVSTDTFTIVREQEGTSARSITVGDQIIAGLTAGLFSESQIGAVGITIDGAGSVLTTGFKGSIMVPYSGMIESVTVLADQTGSIQIDIWKDIYTNFPPTDDDSITALAVPAISSGVKYQDTSLTGWTKAVSAGDIIGFNIDSVSAITKVTVILKVRKTSAI
jgi:hypothetical protein